MSVPDSNVDGCLTVVYRSGRHPIPLTGTDVEFRAAIAAATGIPASAQVLLIAGKKITANEDALAAGQAAGSRPRAILLRAGPGTRPAASSQGPVEHVRTIDRRLVEYRANASALRDTMENALLGFLDESKTIELMNSLLKKVRRVEEDTMQALEELDSITTQDEGVGLSKESTLQLRAEKKAATDYAQRVLRECDHLKDDIDLHIRDPHGELAQARGKG